MNRSGAIHKRQQHADAVKGIGATALSFFGSMVRDEAQASSDLDLFVDYDPAQGFSRLDLAEIKQFLEDKLSVEVGVTTRSSLHPVLRTDIE